MGMRVTPSPTKWPFPAPSRFSVSHAASSSRHPQMVEINPIPPPPRAYSHFGLLIQNLRVLEDTFADPDRSHLDTQILLQLARLGALNLFQTSLPTFPHLSTLVVRTGKTRHRKSTKRAKAPPSHPTRRPSKSRAYEAEITTGVKMVAELERARAALENDNGGPVTITCWAEAMGLDTKTLRHKLHFGWQCRDEIIRSTKSLILYLARNYWGLGIPVEDLLQAGRLGVLQGAERFDPTKGYRFSTYAHYWIRKAMSRLVARHARGILIPQSLGKTINQIQKTRNSSLRKYPNDDEISKLTGLSVEKIRSASNCLRVVGSVDHKIGDYFSGKHMEFMADVSLKTPEESVMREHMRSDICNLLRRLEAREREVVILRYGLRKSSAPRSLEEIGKMLKVSKEWIRKIEKNALAKLREEHTNNTHLLSLLETLITIGNIHIYIITTLSSLINTKASFFVFFWFKWKEGNSK